MTHVREIDGNDFFWTLIQEVQRKYIVEAKNTKESTRPHPDIEVIDSGRLIDKYIKIGRYNM